MSWKKGREERGERRAGRPREREVGRRQKEEHGRQGGRKGEFLAVAPSILSLPFLQ